MTDARIARPEDFEQTLAFLERDPVEAAPVTAWLRSTGPRGLGLRRLWLHDEGICLSGANLLPVLASEEATRAFAVLALAEGRRCSSIVARRATMECLWPLLEPRWGPARAIRGCQVVMCSDGPASLDPDESVRRATSDDFEGFYRASIQMYIEEIGVSPVAFDGGHAYRRRASELIGDGVAFIRTDGDQVVFKAELGVVAPRCAQLQGVWVRPELRGQGIGAAGTAQVLRLAREAGVGTISLAVNDFNHAALRSYERCGFGKIAEQTVVLF